MMKRIAAVLTALALTLVMSSPAQACCATVHNCTSGSFCLYWNSNYGGSQTNQTTAAIFNASGDCWQLNSTWSNKTSSWYANFDVYSGQTVQIYFYDNTSCTGTAHYNGQAPQGQSSMDSYNDWLGSIKLVQP